MSPRGPQSSWDEDSLSLSQLFHHQIAFMKCPHIWGAHKHWNLWCKPSLLPAEVLQGAEGPPWDPQALRRGCIWPWVPCSHKNLLNVLCGQALPGLPLRRGCISWLGVGMFQNPCASLCFEQLFIAWASHSALLSQSWGFLLLPLPLSFFPSSSCFSQLPTCPSSQLLYELPGGWVFLCCFLVCKDTTQRRKNEVWSLSVYSQIWPQYFLGMKFWTSKWLPRASLSPAMKWES